MSDPVTVAAIVAASSIVTAALAILGKKMDAIHGLVNSRLTNALRKIGNLERLLGAKAARRKR